MAITFRHDAAAGLIGSFAAGQAEGRRRNQKYNMALLLQDRRNRQRLGALGGRRGALAPPEGQFAPDPLADDPDLDPHQRRILAAKRRARARKGRLGKDIPFDIRGGGFIPQDAIDRQRDVDDATLANDRRVEAATVADERRAAAAEQTRTSGVRKESRAATGALFDDPIFSKEQQDDANNLNREIGLLQGSDRMSPQDAAATEAKRAELQGKLDAIRDDPQGVAAQTRDQKGEAVFGDAWEQNKHLPWFFDEDGKPALPTGFTMPDGSAAQLALRGKRRTASKALGAAQEAKRARNAEEIKPGEEEARFYQDNVDRAQEAVDDINEQMESLDDKWNEETIEKNGERVQHLGEGKGFEKIDLGGGDEDKAATAKARVDAVVKGVSEILKAQKSEGFEGKKLTEDQAFDQVMESIEAEDRVAAKAEKAQEESDAIDERIRQKVMDRKAAAEAGELGPDDLRLPGEPVQPDSSDLTRPAPATGQLAGLTMKQADITTVSKSPVSAAAFDLDNLQPQNFSHPDLQSPEQVSGEEFDRQWKTLKSGESIRGPDGRIYTKR